VAITFTDKAAAEIKTRVVEAIIRHITPGPFKDDFTLLAAEVL
jgi:serine phosphatase RsbU (regulator of sigma subunit)